ARDLDLLLRELLRLDEPRDSLRAMLPRFLDRCQSVLDRDPDRGRIDLDDHLELALGLGELGLRCLDLIGRRRPHLLHPLVGCNNGLEALICVLRHASYSWPFGPVASPRASLLA